jgi:hypothetical protein
MNTNEPTNRDKALRKLLKEWRTDASLPPRFQETVWQRIELAQTPVSPSVWSAIAHWIGTSLPRPALAVSYVTLLLAVGMTVGWTQAREKTTRVRDELGQRYVRALDPYLATRE